MTFPVFTWFHDAGASHQCQPNVHVTKFGDGYEQRVAVGINTQRDKWSLKFTRSREEGAEILAFVRARGALEAFTWTSPIEEEGVYVCRDWSVEHREGGIMSINLTFERVFET